MLQRLHLLLLITSLTVLSVEICTVQSQPTYISSYCITDAGNYTQSSTFQRNLNQVLSDLVTNSSFSFIYRATSGITGPTQVNGRYYCRYDLTILKCSSCVQAAAKRIISDCNFFKEAVVWYEECTLLYINNSTAALDMINDASPFVMWYTLQNATDTAVFTDVLTSTIDRLINESAYKVSLKGFSTTQVNLTSTGGWLYCLVQCSPDLTGLPCEWCLTKAFRYISLCCAEYVDVAFFYPSCELRYSTLGPLTVAQSSRVISDGSPPPSNTTSSIGVPVPQPVPRPVPGDSGSVGKGAKFYAIAVSVSVAATAMLVGVIWLCFHSKAQKKQNDARKEYEIEGTTHFDLGTLKAATANFSPTNRLGAGGFGAVYRGKLQSGQQVAIKRLSQNSKQGIREFTNEVKLVAKLQHRNLIRLVGFCAEGDERLLVYDFMPKLSLDRYLFYRNDPEFLPWDIRYKIILGIANGLHYLHEGSRLKIVHRDLKSSNILLDEDMSPKIADFGLARHVVVDHAPVNASKIVGTFGYMAPEYAMAGQFSYKSDVYSFGVMLLEIIAGRSNSKSYQPEHPDGLLLHAWKLWKEEEIEELLDPNLQDTVPRTEAMRLTQIALLCIQYDAENRPTINMVVHMLNSDTIVLPYPPPPSPLAHDMNIPVPDMSALREYQQQQTRSEHSTGAWSMGKDLSSP